MLAVLNIWKTTDNLWKNQNNVQVAILLDSSGQTLRKRVHRSAADIPENVIYIHWQLIALCCPLVNGNRHNVAVVYISETDITNLEVYLIMLDHIRVLYANIQNPWPLFRGFSGTLHYTTLHTHTDKPSIITCLTLKYNGPADYQTGGNCPINITYKNTDDTQTYNNSDKF